jgi:hypothetical protein
MISEATAKALDSRTATSSRSATAIGASTPDPARAGHADDVVTLPLGYGRTGAEKVATASASTRARCAPATRPGSTAA